MNIVLCFAWLEEATPFLNNDKTTVVFNKKHLALYKGKHFYYLIMGMGLTNTAMAIGWLNGFMPENKLLYNIGLAGASTENLYTWHKIVKVGKEGSTKNFFPETIDDSQFKKSAITSVLKPANSQYLKTLAPNLVDMEGYAFCKAAQLFGNNAQYVMLKFVSDAGSEEFSTNNWKIPYTASVNFVLNAINHHYQYLANKLN